MRRRLLASLAALALWCAPAIAAFHDRAAVTSATTGTGTVTLETCHSTSSVPPLAVILIRPPSGCPSTLNSSSGPYVTNVSPRRTAAFQLS